VIGALLFFLSLVYFLITYLTTFGEIAEGGNAGAAITWNGALFTLFALHHSIFARAGLRDWVARTVSAELERSIYVCVASVLFVAVCALWRPVPGVAWTADGAFLWTLWLIQAAGIWLILRSAAILDIRELAGLSPAGRALSGSPRDMEFKTTGPYGWVRHPIYSGWFLLVWAVSPMTMTRLVFAAISCAYLLIAIPLEERSMRAGSDGGYDRYAASVRWRLLPGIF
jgi:protein-S-isoprenylcysteine O-methyltransferase Ste14